MKKSKPSDSKIPDKMYFRIGEVSSISGLESYVLRFWETEFKGIHPKRTASGQRLYRRHDVELILKIKHLLHEKKFTIRGAKQFLSSNGKETEKPVASGIIKEVCAELKSILDILDSPQG